MADQTESKTKYGRRKLDEGELTAQASSKNFEGRPGTKFGRRKGAVEAPAAAATAATTDETSTAPKDVPKAKPLPSVPTLAEALAKKPLLVDAMFERELKAEKPRKAALRLFRATEAGRKKARPDVLKRIDAALTALAAPAPADPPSA